MRDFASIRYLLAPWGDLRPQTANEWTGDFPLPPVVKAFYENIGPEDLSIPTGGNPVDVPSLSKLWERQAGYRWHGKTGERLSDWHDEWLVIAAEGGNPFILDVNNNEILFDMVGSGRWAPKHFASDLPTALGALGLIAVTLKKLGDDAWDETFELRENAREKVQVDLAKLIGSLESAKALLHAYHWFEP